MKRQHIYLKSIVKRILQSGFGKRAITGDDVKYWVQYVEGKRKWTDNPQYTENTIGTLNPPNIEIWKSHLDFRSFRRLNRLYTFILNRRSKYAN